MENRHSIRKRLPRPESEQPRTLPFFRKKDEGGDDQGQDDSEPNPLFPGPFKGKGKGKGKKFGNPFFTITFGSPTASTVTAVSTLTIATSVPASVPPASASPLPPPPPPPPELSTSKSTATPTAIPGTTLSTVTTSESSSDPSSQLSASEPSIPTESSAAESPTITLRPTYLAGGYVPETTPPSVDAPPPNRLSSNQAVGVAVGAVFGFILILALALFAYKRWRKRVSRSIFGSESIRSRRSYLSFKRRGEQSLLSPTAMFSRPFTTRDLSSTTAAVTKPKTSLSKWLGQMRNAKSASPETGVSEKSGKGMRSSRVFKGPRSIISTIFHQHPKTRSPPPAAQGSQSSASTDGRSRAQLRQSAFSDASMWTAAATQRTDSGIFVPPTALSYPRVVVTSPREPPLPGSTEETPPVGESRRTVRFSNKGVLTTSGRASLVSVDSRSGIPSASSAD